MRIIDINVNEQSKALYRKTGGGNEWRELGEKGKEQVLTEAQILELSELIVKIENHYGFPCDIEWAFEDGKFYIVQSRPITTLAGSGDMLVTASLFHEAEWEHYLTRPFTLFGASLWQGWYGSEASLNLFGVQMKNALFVEQAEGVARNYRIKKELTRFGEGMKIFLEKDEKKARFLLDEALKLNAEAEKYLSGEKEFGDFSSAVDFLVNLALRATVLPFWILHFSTVTKYNDENLAKIAEKLRGISHYPNMVSKIVTPLAQKILEEKGEDKKYADLLTVSELLSGKVASVEQRGKEKEKGKRFLYEVFGGEEKVSFVDDVPAIIGTLEHVPVLSGEVRGQTAYKGKVVGTARVVYGIDKNAIFNKGDILISINSNPSLMPFLEKCGGVVTDEGGIMCHAAIIAREMKKPCVIGTKFATSLIKDGDLVEVDADNGVVRIIEKAQ